MNLPLYTGGWRSAKLHESVSAAEKAAADYEVMRDQVLQLTELAPEYKDRGESLLGLTADGDGASRWSQWWAEISKYFQIDFNADENVRPLLAGQQLNQLRLALSLTIEQAQWAALNGDAKVYTQALDDARSVLLANFNAVNPQSKAMLDSLNALENVMLPLELDGRKDARERARYLLERVGLGQRLSHSPRQLSGGEQQRVAIARAFAAEPAVLFADEPTGNLDSHTGERISDLLFELNKERGTTLVLVTHDERLAHRCGRLIRLEAGHLVTPLEP